MGGVLLLVLGVACAGVGGEAFVRGAVGVASWARIPPGIIGSTVAAFATSSPELAVAVTSAGAGQPELALGDALGSNVVNLGLVLGVAVALAGLRVDRGDLRRDLPAVLAAPVLIGLLALDGSLSRADAAVLLVCFALWLGLTARDAARARDAIEVVGEHRRGRALGAVATGLAFLVVAGKLVVSGAEEVGEALGLAPFVVGSTLVALGTSAPELATTVVARLRGHDEIGVGTVLGSNVFNSLWIIGVAAMIHPISVGGGAVTVGLVAGAVLALLVVPGGSGRLGRGRGLALLIGYVLTVSAVLAVGPG